MKNFLVLITFISTVLFGLMVSDSFDDSAKFDNYPHRTEETFEKPLFTLQQANLLVGKKVISKNVNFKENEIGRIISFEMVAPDKFLIEIYWGNGAEDENSTVTFHDKQWFSRDFEVLD